MARVLGIDYGAKRIGIAVSDENGQFAFPHDTLEGDSVQNLKKIVDIIHSEQIQTVVVGNPLTLNGELAGQAGEVENFVNALKRSADISIILEDERLTSKLASSLIKDHPFKKSKEKGAIDQQAAVQILQGYLDRKNQ